MNSVFDRPCEPEKTCRDENGTDVGERQAVFWLCFVVISVCKGIVDGVDFGYDEPDGDEESEARAKVHEADLGGVEGVRRGTVDGLEVRVEGVGGAEENGLVDCHCENDGLGEEDAERADHAASKFCGEGPVVLVRHTVLDVGVGHALVMVFAGFEDRGCVGFFEKEKANDRIDGADDGENPEDPAPAEILRYEAAKKGPKGRTE